jgi:hypothetical protein
MLVATPDEILWKGLELGGFDGRRQQKVKQKTGRLEDTFEASRDANSLPIAKRKLKRRTTTRVNRVAINIR